MEKNYSSRISKFYKHDVNERLELLHEKEVISEEDYRALQQQQYLLNRDAADKMIENVVDVFGLPMGLGLNFLVNDEPFIVPMVVEEPSIVAAVSSAAKVVQKAGGFSAESDDPVLIGQIQLIDVEQPSQVKQTITDNKKEVLNLANGLHPNMVKRGGGAVDLEVHIHHQQQNSGNMLVVHLLVDTRDAMGANLVNSMCEGVAPLIEKMTGHQVCLRILSNLTDRAMVRGRCEIPTDLLDFNEASGEEVRDGIIRASEFAAADPYRAATHNKGIMNGIDAVALATGNDWRAIESAAHAYAAQGEKYAPLTHWTKNDAGDLVGKINIPLKVGTVGGSLKSNKSVGLALRILGTKRATKLAEVMGAVGLAQNLSALRSLGTEGIQRGHMTLHARSVASTAGTPDEIFDEVLDRLLESSEIKVWKAKEIIEEIKAEKKSKVEPSGTDTKVSESYGYGKLIITGEHSVVYGKHAVAAPIALKMRARVWDSPHNITLLIPDWGVEHRLQFDGNHEYSVYKALEMILNALDLHDESMTIKVSPEFPKAMGMGGSAALAVGIIRALDTHFELGLSQEDVRELSFKSEDIIHGGASGIDNTVSTYGQLIQYQKDNPPEISMLDLKDDIPIVIGISGVESMTSQMVNRVREARKSHPEWYDHIFDRMDDLSLQAREAIEDMDLSRLGVIMNMNHGYLNTLSVSSAEVEELVTIARENSALGAKLTGGGGGGAMVALCNSADMQQRIKQQMQAAGYDALLTNITSAITNGE